MSDGRITYLESVVPASPTSAGVLSGRGIVCGQTGRGPTKATVIRSLGEFDRLFGSTGGTAMRDAAALAFVSGLAELVVQRATGPAPVKATGSLDSGKIVLTAREVGAFANAWTAAWTAASKTLTLTGATVETFTGTTAAELAAQINTSTQVTATVTGLPASNVAATNLAGGTDDFANVDWTVELARLGGDDGPGVIWLPGILHTVAAGALAAHCAATGRLGAVIAAAGSTKAALLAAKATIAAIDGAQFLDLIGPWAAYGGKVMDPVGFVAGLRSMAHVDGAGTSPRQEAFAKRVHDVAPELEFTAAEWAELDAAGVSILRTEHGVTRLASWKTVKAMGGNANLAGAHYRDFVNDVRFEAMAILAGFDGKPSTAATFTQIEGDIAAMLDRKAAFLSPRLAADRSLIDPGYKVTAGTGSDPADNRAVVAISLRLTETLDWFTFTLSVGDAGATI